MGPGIADGPAILLSVAANHTITLILRENACRRLEAMLPMNRPPLFLLGFFNAGLQLSHIPAASAECLQSYLAPPLSAVSGLIPCGANRALLSRTGWACSESLENPHSRCALVKSASEVYKAQ